MSRVMRKSDGDNVEIINTMGQLAHCQIQKNTTLKILQVEHTARDKNKAILTVGLSHPSKLEMITEKACELGVDELIIFKGDKSSTKNLSASKLTRLETIRDSALKQSKRLWDMTIRLTPSLKTIDFSGKKVYFADLTSQQSLKLTDNDAMIIVGPESGLSDREIAFCKEQKLSSNYTW